MVPVFTDRVLGWALVATVTVVLTLVALTAATETLARVGDTVAAITGALAKPSASRAVAFAVALAAVSARVECSPRISRLFLRGRVLWLLQVRPAMAAA
jgi:hypothetical protein